MPEHFINFAKFSEREFCRAKTRGDWRRQHQISDPLDCINQHCLVIKLESVWFGDQLKNRHKPRLVGISASDWLRKHRLKS